MSNEMYGRERGAMDEVSSTACMTAADRSDSGASLWRAPGSSGDVGMFAGERGLEGDKREEGEGAIARVRRVTTVSRV